MNNPADPTPAQGGSHSPRDPSIDSALPPGADAEDRFNMFWKENGTSIFVSIIIGAIVVVGVQTWRYIDNRIEEGISERYSQADSAEELLAFAVDNEGHSLAAAALFKLANGEFARGDYMQAGEHFAAVAEQLSGTPFADRAVLGAAVCRLLGGDKEGGLADLRAIYDNPSMLENTRAEAGFNLAVHYLEAKDYPSLKGVVDVADTLGEKDFYAQSIRQMRNLIPIGK